MNKEKLRDFILKALAEKNATNVTCMKIEDDAPLADYMIFASGRSIKNVSSIAEYVSLELKRASCNSNIEGLRSSDWVLVDAGDVIVHLFHPQAREKLKLEEFWNKNN